MLRSRNGRAGAIDELLAIDAEPVSGSAKRVFWERVFAVKKRILCFGDSNTYGYDPRGGRFDEETRWTCRLGKILGDGYAVIEEGFNGRTCVYDDPIEGGYKSGADYLPPCLMSHSPLELVVLMLGTNDAKRRFGLTPMTIGEGMMQLVRLTRLYAVDGSGSPSKILMVAPPPILETLPQTRHGECFGDQAVAVTRGLAAEYARIAKLLRCEFFDAAGWAEVSTLDAVHLSREGHAGLAEGLARKIRQILE